MIGARIGHYEITGRLGSGGMGEVYQAIDSKLQRNVAVKILPDSFARDAEWVARFKREARVLASLNHPRIAVIYGIEESEGRHFLVMELASGETLAQRIGRGALPIDDALPIATQIAEALEAAHEKGFVHRDLKPANIKVDAEGQVKLLDFGLAKAFAAESSPLDISDSPTLSAVATNAGVLLGTASYMSPEQARGARVDPRTDIFAFGCVLYEMLTGRKAFPGDNVADILAAVLKSEPDWSRLPTETPPAILRLLRRCLQKDRRRRLQSAGDARIDIEEASAEHAAHDARLAPASMGARSRLAWVVALGAIAIAATFAFLYYRKPLETPPETLSEIGTPSTSDPMSFALSADGRQVVFVASGDGPSRLWLRRLDTATAHPLEGTEGASYPFWSPDSRSVAFFAVGKLKRIDIGGGPPREIATAEAGRGGSWNAADIILFTPRPGSTLFRVPASGGEAAPLKIAGAASPRFPLFLPDGRQFIFLQLGNVESSGESRVTQGIYMASLDSVQARLLTASDTAGRFMSPNLLLFVRGATLVAQHFDIARGVLSGDPVTVADTVAFDLNVFSSAVSVSANGLLAYRSGGVLNRRQLQWFDHSGVRGDVAGAPDENDLLDPELSPDGRQVAVVRLIRAIRNIWLLDVGRGVLSRLTDEGKNNALGATNPRWSHDGRIAFHSNRRDKSGIYVKSAGSAAEMFLTSPGSPDDWSPDSRNLIYTRTEAQTLGDLWILPLEGDRTPLPFATTGYDETNAKFSPDGHWIAYESNESGRAEIYVQAFPAHGSRQQISTDGGVQPRWSHDGKELFYISPDAKMMAATIRPSSTGLEIGKATPLFQTRIVRGGGSGFGLNYDVAADGRFLINVSAEETITSPILLLQNWKPRN